MKISIHNHPNTKCSFYLLNGKLQKNVYIYLILLVKDI